MERLGQSARAGSAEKLQRLPLRRCGECEEAQVRLTPARLDHLVQPVFPIGIFFSILRLRRRAEDGLHFHRRIARLAGMRLIHDDRIPSLGNLGLPFLRLFLLLRRRLLLALRTGGVEQTAQHERKLLQRGDDDLRAVNQRRRQLLRVLVNRLHHALRVFDLVNRILQLPVEHLPVGDHHHAVEHLRILRIVQAGEPVREPRDAVRLPAAGGMLDEVVAPRPFVTRPVHQLSHRVELVIPREDHRLLRDPAVPAATVVRFLLLLFDEEEVSENVEEARELQHVLPEVARAIAGLVRRIPLAADDLSRMAATVERQEERLLSRQPRRHVDLVRVGGEMHQRPLFELKQWRAWVAVLAVLLHRLPPALPRAGILQLHGRHREAVHCQHHVERAVVAGMTRHLSRHREPVLTHLCQQLEVRPVRRLEVGEAKRLPVKLEPVPQHMERAFRIQLLHQRGEQQRLQPRRVQRPHRLPQIRLRVFEKGEHLGREKRPLLVPFGEAAGLPAAPRQQDFFDVDLEASFGSLCVHDSQPRILFPVSRGVYRLRKSLCRIFFQLKVGIGVHLDTRRSAFRRPLRRAPGTLFLTNHWVTRANIHRKEIEKSAGSNAKEWFK